MKFFAGVEPPIMKSPPSPPSRTRPGSDGSVQWKNIRAMTNYWAFQAGTYWNMW